MIRAARAIVGVVLFTLPLLSGYRRFVENATRAGEGVGRNLGLLQQPSTFGVESVPLPLDGGTTQSADESLSPAVSSADFVRGVAPKAKPQNMRSILISEQTVLRLAQSGSVPQAVAVPAEHPRPAGLQLSGVSGFGVGLEEGDVLFQVAGVAVHSPTQVAEIVRAARERRLHSLHARLWRGAETIALVVGMPYLDSSGKLKQ